MSRGVAGFAISGANVESAPLSLATSHFLSESPESSRGEVISEWLPCALLLFSRYVMSNSCDPMDYRPPGSSLHGIPRQEYWSGLSFPSPGDLPDPGIEPMSPALACRFFTAEPLGKAYCLCRTCDILRVAWTLMCVVDPLTALWCSDCPCDARGAGSQVQGRAQDRIAP